jgi:hypothetical protein
LEHSTRISSPASGKSWRETSSVSVESSASRFIVFLVIMVFPFLRDFGYGTGTRRPARNYSDQRHLSFKKESPEDETM